MKKKYKEIWLRALRGKSRRGEYRQCRRTLVIHQRSGDSFCCLGVLQNEVCGFYPDLAEESDYPEGATSYDAAALSQAMLEIVGLDPASENILMDMNDLHQKSFNEIANWIEKSL